jgi:hypothetical protein
MSLPKFHKIYFPGLISLVGLLLALIIYSFNSILLNKPTGIKVAWGGDSMFEYWTKFRHTPNNPHTFRKFSNSVLTGEDRNDDLILKEVENNIRNLAISPDTVKGYTVSFGARTDYQTIVNAIDICSRYETNGANGIHFILYKDRILVWEGQSYQPKPYSLMRL